MTSIGHFYLRAALGAALRKRYDLFTPILVRAATSPIPQEDFDAVADLILRAIKCCRKN